MRAQDVIHVAAWVLGSGVAALIAAFWLFAPALAHLNGELFNKEAGPLAAAEEQAWETFRKTGEFPGVDGKTLSEPGWENALMVDAGKKAFR